MVESNEVASNEQMIIDKVEDIITSFFGDESKCWTCCELAEYLVKAGVVIGV